MDNGFERLDNYAVFQIVKKPEEEYWPGVGLFSIVKQRQ